MGYLLLLLLSSAISAADTLFDNRYNLQQQQWDFQDRESRQNQLNKNQFNRVDPPESDQPVIGPGDTFFIHTIQLDGITKIPARQQAEWTRQFENTALDLQAIMQLIGYINQWYTDNGYTTSRAFLAIDQSLETGTLRIIVEEGSIQDIVNSRDQPDPSFRFAMPFTGKHLSIRDLEQGLENLNRHRHNDMKFDIVPAETGYGSRVIITNTSRVITKNHATIQYFYETDDDYTWFPDQITLLGDDFFGLSEQVILLYNQNRINETDQATSVRASASIPYGYWLFDYTYSLFTFNQLFPGGGLLLATNNYGSNEQNSLGVQRTIHRGQSSKTVARATLGTANQIQYQNLDYSEVRSYKKTVGTIGLDYTVYARHGTGFLSLDYHHGLPWLNGDTDPGDPFITEPRLIFSKVTLSTQASISNLFGTRGYYTLNTQHQWTRYTLYPEDGIVLGGRWGIRGFQGVLSGDYGYYANHNIIMPVRESQLSIVCGLDHGTVFSVAGQYGGTTGEGSLTGGAIGIQYKSFMTTFDLLLAKPLQWPDYIHPDTEIIYATLTWKWL